jgi:ABC-type sulfate/molybdate transport systems ATPase subunit
VNPEGSPNVAPAKSSEQAVSEQLRVEGLTVQFGAATILRNVELVVRTGETLVICGPSGCGKSTLLKAIGGMLTPSSGRVALARASADRNSDSTEVGIDAALYLDQEPLLFEHLTVFENVAFALRMKRVPEAALSTRVDSVLEATGIKDQGRKLPHQLSGGQKQRAAFARAVIARPRLLLLDEPFSALDAQTRQQLQTVFCQLRRISQLTAIFVTHDVREALTVGTHFGRMNEGFLQIYSSRQEFITDPANGVQQELQFWKDAAAGM